MSKKNLTQAQREALDKGRKKLHRMMRKGKKGKKKTFYSKKDPN